LTYRTFVRIITVRGLFLKRRGIYLTNMKGANPVQFKQHPMTTKAVSWALREMTKTHRDRVAVTWRKIATSWQATSCAR